MSPITMPQPHISSSGKLRINPNIDPIFGALDCIKPMNPKMDPMSMTGTDRHPAKPAAAGLAGCLSVPVMLIGSILGFIGLMQSNAPKMGSILGLILNLPLLLICGCGMVMGLMMPGV